MNYFGEKAFKRADPRRGDVWLAYTHSQPRDTHQPCFVVIVSADSRNRARNHAMVVPIFSTGNLGPTRLVISAEGTGLSYDSVVFCEELTTIDRDLSKKTRRAGERPMSCLTT